MIVVTVARKPLAASTVAANVLTHGVGALNIDGARIAPVEGEELRRNAVAGDYLGSNTFRIRDRRVEDKPAGMGRWPSNVILGHAGGCSTDTCTPGCPVAELDQQSGESKSSGFGGRTIVKRTTAAERDGNRGPAYGAESRPEGAVMTSYDDVGGASRFFKQVGGQKG